MIVPKVITFATTRECEALRSKAESPPRGDRRVNQGRFGVLSVSAPELRSATKGVVEEAVGSSERSAPVMSGLARVIGFSLPG